MSDKQFTFHLNQYGYKHVYDIEALENYLQWSTRDMESLKEQIKKTEEYQELVKLQIGLVSSIETIPEVNLQRGVTYKGKVEFFVSVRDVPQNVACKPEDMNFRELIPSEFNGWIYSDREKLELEIEIEKSFQ